MTSLDDAARGVLRRLAADEPLIDLYRQPDRAVFLAERAGIVLKAYVEGATLHHEWAMAQRASAAGLPLPELLGFAAGLPAVIAMRHVTGQPLGADNPSAAHDAGRLLALFHRLGAAPPFTTGEVRWERHILAWAERELRQIGRIGALYPEMIAMIRDHFARHAALLVDRPIALLHGDLQRDHVLVDGGRVVAFLDFADAQPGDPLLDLAVLTLRDSALVAPLLGGYGSIDDDAATRALLLTYRLLRRVGEVPWLLGRGYDAEAAESTAAIHAILGDAARAGG